MGPVRVPTSYSASTLSGRSVAQWYESNRAVHSRPADRSSISRPPGCESRKGVTSYTLPRTMIHADSAVQWDATSFQV